MELPNGASAQSRGWGVGQPQVWLLQSGQCLMVTFGIVLVILGNFHFAERIVVLSMSKLGI